MERMMLRAATVQFEPRPGAKEYNLARVEHFARAAAADGVQLVAFPDHQYCDAKRLLNGRWWETGGRCWATGT
jgi:predicted amidohydrolase